MKTAKEWFEQLPEPIRTQAINNLDADSSKKEFEQFHVAVGHAFNWELTEQGTDYWNNIFNRAYMGEFTPNLNGWILVGERLPTADDGDEFGNVLILRETTSCQIETCKSIIKWNMLRHSDPDTTFWQPMPKLPEVRNETN